MQCTMLKKTYKLIVKIQHTTVLSGLVVMETMFFIQKIFKRSCQLQAFVFIDCVSVGYAAN